MVNFYIIAKGDEVYNIGYEPRGGGGRGSEGDNFAFMFLHNLENLVSYNTQEPVTVITKGQITSPYDIWIKTFFDLYAKAKSVNVEFKEESSDTETKKSA